MERQVQATARGSGTSGAPLDPRDEVQQFLDRFARAVTRGDTRTIVSLWEPPAFIVGDHATQAVNSAAEIEQFFAATREMDSPQGVADTRAQIVRLEWPSPRIALVEVRWPWTETDGSEQGYETATYTLLRDRQNQLRLRVALVHGSTQDQH